MYAFTVFIPCNTPRAFFVSSGSARILSAEVPESVDFSAPSEPPTLVELPESAEPSEAFSTSFRYPLMSEGSLERPFCSISFVLFTFEDKYPLREDTACIPRVSFIYSIIWDAKGDALLSPARIYPVMEVISGSISRSLLPAGRRESLAGSMICAAASSR